MYRIIGADGKSYGPISVEQLRQWIREGRANAQTQTLAEGATEWKPLGTLPEFAAQFAPPVPPVIGPSGAGWHPPKTNASAQAGMILGILSVTLVCCCYGFPFNILGLIFSLIGLGQIHENPQAQQGRGMAITGLVLSIASLILAAVVIMLELTMGHYDVMWNYHRF